MLAETDRNAEIKKLHLALQETTDDINREKTAAATQTRIAALEAEQTKLVQTEITLNEQAQQGVDVAAKRDKLDKDRLALQQRIQEAQRAGQQEQRQLSEELLTKQQALQKGINAGISERSSLADAEAANEARIRDLEKQRLEVQQKLNEEKKKTPAPTTGAFGGPPSLRKSKPMRRN